MAKATIGFGLALILVGIAGYFGTGRSSPTALIPAVIGLLLAVLGAVALREHVRAHAMHGAVVVGLLGFLGSASGLLKLVTWLAGGVVARPAAVVSQSITAILCAVFVVLCIRSFINARRQRTAAG
ncbi:MAG: hypothetical protein H0W76_24490 [Pyrinomonadaceae bacterium]|nr:hypothetical protein [Pyrinomonadaceae bacterium]